VFEAACRHGRTLSQADAIALASAAAEPAPGRLHRHRASRPGDGGQVSGPLPEREREIVALLACGATDAQIAGQPYVLMNTVRSHLEPIRDKTGARRRTNWSATPSTPASIWSSLLPERWASLP
jgi:DNA-binding NarL/FixJ family response regulator